MRSYKSKHHSTMWCNVLTAVLLDEQLIKKYSKLQQFRFQMFFFCSWQQDFTSLDREEPYARCIYSDGSRIDIIGFADHPERAGDYNLICKHIVDDGPDHYLIKTLSELEQFGCKRILRCKVTTDFELGVPLDNDYISDIIDGCLLCCLRDTLFLHLHDQLTHPAYYSGMFGTSNALTVTIKNGDWDSLQIFVDNSFPLEEYSGILMSSRSNLDKTACISYLLDCSQPIDSDCRFTIK